MTGHVVDLYAGPGGWDQGMRDIGVTDVIGIDIDPNACATATAAGHKRIQADVSTVPTADHAGAWGLVASPPCQSWSMAGKRLGEADRARVHQLIDTYAAGSDQRGTGWADERSHHAAQPVRWVRDLRPAWVCMEQVPPVLPLWQHIAEVLRRWGYRTWTGVLNAADYGVPQTRERAFLVATRTGVARPPAPTHARDPEGTDLFGGELLPWVSMAGALGWDGADRPARTVCGDRSPRWAYGPGSSYATGWTLDRRTNSRGPGGTTVPVAPVPVDRPAPTLTAEAGHQWVLRNNTSANACTRGLDEPAGTIFFGARLNDVSWVLDRPAGGERQHAQSVRVGIHEAAVLQSFPADYPWHGTKTAQFQQVGNAVPPRLAAAVVKAATS